MATTKKEAEQPEEVLTPSHNLFFPPTTATKILKDMDDLILSFREESEISLTDTERRRLMNSGIRRYGFIDKVSDIAHSSSQYSPMNFNAVDLKNLLRDVEFFRNLLARIRELERLVTNALFTTSDDAFRMSLIFYNYVRYLARTGEPGAVAIFNMLQPFFNRPRRSSSELTEPEIERDVKALLHGKKDGKVVIENKTPHAKGGKHVVFDDAHRDRVEFEEIEKAEAEN